MKVIQLHEETLNQFLNPTPTPKNDPKIKSKSIVRIWGNIENESCSTTWVDPKAVVGPYSDTPDQTTRAPK